MAQIARAAGGRSNRTSTQPRKSIPRLSKRAHANTTGGRRVAGGTVFSAGASIPNVVGGALRRLFTSPVPRSAQPMSPLTRVNERVASNVSGFSPNRPPRVRKNLRRGMSK